MNNKDTKKTSLTSNNKTVLLDTLDKNQLESLKSLCALLSKDQLLKVTEAKTYEDFIRIQAIVKAYDTIYKLCSYRDTN